MPPNKNNAGIMLLVVCVTLYFAIATGVSMGASGTYYYVSSSTGNDNNAGNSESKPWRTLARVNNANLLPGDSVFFKRGDEWRGQLVPKSGSTLAPITYSAYSKGAKPLLLGSISQNNPREWQHAGGNIWTTRKPAFHEIGSKSDFSSTKWHLHTEGGAQAKIISLKSELTDGLEITSDRSGTEAGHIQLYTTGLSFKDSDSLLFTFRMRTNKPFTFNNIKLMKSSAPWNTYSQGSNTDLNITSDWKEFSVRFTAYQMASDGRITLYLGGAIPTKSEFYFQPVALKKLYALTPDLLPFDVGNIIFDQGKSVGIKKWKQADLKRQGDYWYNLESRQVYLYSKNNPADLYRNIELALNRNIINQVSKSNVVYENLTLSYGAAHGIGGSNTHHIVIRDCDICWIGGGHQFTRANGAPVRFGNGIEFWSEAHDNLVEGCRIWEIYDAALTNQGNSRNVQANITYRNNVIWNSEYSFEFWNGPKESRTHNISFEHNTCVNAGFGWGHNQRPDPNGRHLMFYTNQSNTDEFHVKNNIFYNATESLLAMSNDWTAGLRMDNNIWFQSHGDMIKFMQMTYNRDNFYKYQKEIKLDTHSIVSDPNFTDIKKLDFRLTTNNQARKLYPSGNSAGSLKRLKE